MLRCEWRLHVLPRRGRECAGGRAPIGSVCAEMTLRVQGSQKSSRRMLSVLRGGGMKVL